jgi:nicotinate-nucleotide adenylyltransferase
MTRKKIGFFGGTFDPIHFGHLHLALCMLEMRGFDEILFCPAQCSPHKVDEKPLIANQHRQKIVELAISPIKNFRLIDNELRRSPPSYTIDTIQELLERDKNSEMHLILGEDTIEKLASWKDIERLIALAPPCIGMRTVKEKNSFNNLPPFLFKAVKKGMVDIPILEISSTSIRKRLKMGQYCGYLVPAKVLDYIYEHHLY